MRWKDFLIGLGTAGTGVLLWLVLIPWQIPALAAHADEISPALFPRILAWLLILLGVVHMAGHWPRRAEPGPAATVAEDSQWLPLLRATGALGLAAAYVVLLPVLGYVAASALVLACFVLYLGQGRLVRALAVAVPTAFLLAELFWRGLNVPLPRAVWMG